MVDILHYIDVIMGAVVSQITSLMVVFSTVYFGTDQIKWQSSASLAFVRGIHRLPVNSPHKGPVTQKMFPFEGVIMTVLPLLRISHPSTQYGLHNNVAIYLDLYLYIQCCAVITRSIFFKIPTKDKRHNKRHPIVRLWGRGVECLLWFYILIHSPPLLPQCRM